MSLDMDGLKMINDTYGHIEGDNALKALGEILKKVSDDNISAARTGGDEFMLCISAGDEEIPCHIQADILSLVDAYNQTSRKPYLLSVSIGYAQFTEKGGIIGCMQQADQKMYADKSTKKNTRANMS